MGLKKLKKAVSDHVQRNRLDYVFMGGAAVAFTGGMIGLHIAFKRYKLVSMTAALEAIQKNDYAGLYFHVGSDTMLLTKATEEVRKILLEAAGA